MLTSEQINFEDMATRYGEITAYGYLEQIERAAGLSPVGLTGIAPETRLTNAIRMQDAGANSNKRLN